MNPTDLPSDDPAVLGSLISMAYDPAGETGSAGAAPAWSPQDLAAVWRHQLAAPLALDLWPEGEAAGEPPPRTFADLLGHPRPPLDWLHRLKEFGRDRTADDSTFPVAVATVLYYAAIALALTRAGARITSLDDAALAHGFDHAARRPWLDGQTRELFQGLLRHSA